MIFSEYVREDASAKLARESSFAFLDRSARPEMSRAREALTEWCTSYPERDELVARFRSNNDEHFRSAEFELLLYTSLSKSGFSLTPHPELPNGGSRRPDFLVTTPAGQRFYLEAVLARERREDTTHHPLVATTLDVFSTHTHRNFCVEVHTRGVPTTQPSGRALIRQVLSWLDQLDPDALEDSWPHQIPFEWGHEDLVISLRAIPLRADRRGFSTRLLGVQRGQAGWLDASTSVKEAIRFKGGRYGQLEYPLVIAVNFDGMFLDEYNERRALFGDEQIVVSVSDPERPPRLERVPNGAWTSEAGPTFTRVSAAWIFGNLSCYTLARKDATLYFNPWAASAPPDELRAYSYCEAIASELQRTPGKLLSSELGLPESWPG